MFAVSISEMASRGLVFLIVAILLISHWSTVQADCSDVCSTDIDCPVSNSFTLTYKCRDYFCNPICTTGPNVGENCLDDSDCDGAACLIPGLCDGGPNDGDYCNEDSDCAGSECQLPGLHKTCVVTYTTGGIVLLGLLIVAFVILIGLLLICCIIYCWADYTVWKSEEERRERRRRQRQRDLRSEIGYKRVI